MTRRVVFRPEAERELIEALQWYDAKGPGLGAEFLRALDAAVAHIQRHPEIGPVVFGHARRATLRRFPYSLIYTADGDEVIVAACFHERRHPRRWQDRT